MSAILSTMNLDEPYIQGMESADLNMRAHIMFEYALGLPHSFALQTINTLIKQWRYLDPVTQESLKYRLRTMVDRDDAFRTEQDLVLTFTDQRIRDHGPLGDRKAAGAWKGFYDIILSYQAPPET